MTDSTSNGDTAASIVLPPPRSSVGTLVAWLHRHVRLLWTIIAIEVAAGLLVASTVTLPYYAISPGSATNVNELLQVPKDVAYPARGQILFTTVSLSKARLLDVLQGWLDPDVDIVPEKDVFGPTPPKDFQQQNVQEMDDSILVAEVVALRHLGYTVPEHGDGALVAAVTQHGPADGHLKPGDVITQFNDKHIELGSDLVSAISTYKYADTVRLTVTTPGQPQRVESVKLGGVNAEKTVCAPNDPQSGKGCLGIILGTKSHRFDEPVKLSIDARGIGGPSAGLAFTLAILDALRPGELTGGHKVAVTGTIDINGKVGDVGGVVQKTAAVRASGAELFLVPPGEYKAAKAHAGRHLKVVMVTTLDDALQVLRGLGGDIADVTPTTVTTVAPRRTHR